MASLQRFKLLATQCGVAQSPTRSPTTSPMVQLRRRKITLRMLLNRSYSSRRREPPESPSTEKEKKRSCSEDGVGRKLRDLFISSPPPPPPFEGKGEKTEFRLVDAVKMRGSVCAEPGYSRPVWVGLRNRLLRRSWRPMLLTIPE